MNTSGKDMSTLQDLFDNNRAWVEDVESRHPGFFRELSDQQSPQYLWIGCSDSRVPANEIVGLMPGELFVHRNVANLVSHTDFNCLSVLQYAVEILKVKHIIVCGHYGCGGVRAALLQQQNGLIDNWLSNIKDLYLHNQKVFRRMATDEARVDKLCEMNVKQQVRSVCRTTIVQDAWARGQALTVHGWIYNIKDGLLNDLGVTIDSPSQIPDVYRILDEGEVTSDLAGE